MATVEYLAKMRELLQDAGHFTDEEIADIIKVARSHAGGMASGRARRGEGDTPPMEPDMGGMMGKLMDMMKSMMAKLGGQPQGADEPSVSGTEWLAVAGDGKRFSELPFTFMAPPATIQVLPKPGTYSHPKYGDIDITADDLREFVSNFKEGVYGQGVPIQIDFEHSDGDFAKRGAVGYVKFLKPIENYKGGVSAEVEWTERGREALEEDAYKCFSPEWYEEWKHPSTGKIYHNVLIGGALTMRPFFKEDAMKPLAASEGPSGLRVYLRQAFVVETDESVQPPLRFVWEETENQIRHRIRDPEDFKPDSFRTLPMQGVQGIQVIMGRLKDETTMTVQALRFDKDDWTAAEAKKWVADHPKLGSMPDVDDVHVPGLVKINRGGKAVEIELTEEQRQALAEGKDLMLTEDQLVALEPREGSERIAATEEKLRQATERLGAMERERDIERKEFRTRRFTEIVQGRAQGTSFDGPAFVGDVAKHVGTLEVLADAKGEDSDPFKDYVQMQQAHAEQIRASALFAEAGYPGGNSGGSAEEEVTRKAQAKGDDFAVAVQAVLKEDPFLARRYSEERNVRARM